MTNSEHECDGAHDVLMKVVAVDVQGLPVSIEGKPQRIGEVCARICWHEAGPY